MAQRRPRPRAPFDAHPREIGKGGGRPQALETETEQVMEEKQVALRSSEVDATLSRTLSNAGDETGVDQARLAELLESFLEASESVDTLEAEIGRVTRALQGARGLKVEIMAITAREIRAQLARLKTRRP